MSIIRVVENGLKGYKHQIKDCYPEKPSIAKIDVVERVIMSNPKKPRLRNLLHNPKQLATTQVIVLKLSCNF